MSAFTRTSEKGKMTIKKSLLRDLFQTFSLRICQSLYDVKPQKAQSEQCAPYCAIGS
jgi:hypothetical protein